MTAAAEILVGGIVTTIGLFCLVLSQSFEVRKLGLWGAEIVLDHPFTWSGIRKALYPGVVVFFIGVGVSGHGTYQKLFPPKWPTELSAVRTAELQLSDIDDLMIVRANGAEIARGHYGNVPSWVSFKSKLRPGPNSFEVIIINGKYGGCGGTLTIRLNGLLNPDYTWTWFEQVNQLPDIVCFQRVKTLNLE